MPPLLGMEIGCPSSKKQKVPRQWPPCPKQLRYEDGEKLGDDDEARVQGSDSRFYRSWWQSWWENVERLEDSFSLPSGTPLELAELDTLKRQRHSGEVLKVLDELYRVDGFTSDDGSQTIKYKDEAFVRVYDNKLRSQYYLQTINANGGDAADAADAADPTTATVTHIAHNRFWSHGEERGEERGEELEKGVVAYSRGFLWCNASPNWTWDNRPHTTRNVIRCQIQLPEGTQVVVDRSPVYGTDSMTCQFDRERTSRFPDVLLPPAKFEITSVKHYPAPKVRIDDAAFKKLQERMNSDRHDHVLTDEEYAEHVFYVNDNADEFIDVRLRVTHMMKLPQPQEDASAFTKSEKVRAPDA